MKTTRRIGPQPQLRVWRWIAHRYPSWLTRRRPEHRNMMARMFGRIIAQEAQEE